MRIIAKYSDYAVQSIEFFITAIENYLSLRDLPGLTNNKVEKIIVSKQHPLVTLRSVTLQARDVESEMSGLLPAISITPSSMTEEAFTLGESMTFETVDDSFIENLNYYESKTNKEIQKDVLLTQKQIEDIKYEYKRAGEGEIRAKVNQWSRNESLSLSVWSDSADITNLTTRLIDSCLADIAVGFMGDQSQVRSFTSRADKGLANFNFGRTIFGSEYSLTFLNTFNNYTIFFDEKIDEVEVIGEYNIPGDTPGGLQYIVPGETT
jgi:hypothetical protein